MVQSDPNILVAKDSSRQTTKVTANYNTGRSSANPRQRIASTSHINLINGKKTDSVASASPACAVPQTSSSKKVIQHYNSGLISSGIGTP